MNDLVAAVCGRRAFAASISKAWATESAAPFNRWPGAVIVVSSRLVCDISHIPSADEAGRERLRPTRREGRPRRPFVHLPPEPARIPEHVPPASLRRLRPSRSSYAHDTPSADDLPNLGSRGKRPPPTGVTMTVQALSGAAASVTQDKPGTKAQEGPETFLLRRHSQDGKHRKRADTERKEHDRQDGENRPDTTVRVLPHECPVAGDSHDEDEDG